MGVEGARDTLHCRRTVPQERWAPGSTRGMVPTRRLLPERPPVQPSYKELFPKYAPPDRAPPYHMLFPDRSGGLLLLVLWSIC